MDDDIFVVLYFGGLFSVTAPCVIGLLGLIVGLINIIAYKLFVAVLGFPEVTCHIRDAAAANATALLHFT